MLTTLTRSLRRYATYDANNDSAQNKSGIGEATGHVMSSASANAAQNGSKNEYATGATSAGHATDAMADLHLSGSDPRMFPGILTREQRSGSLKNLAHADDKPANSDGNTN
jgi:AMP deaminase